MSISERAQQWGEKLLRLPRLTGVIVALPPVLLIILVFLPVILLVIDRELLDLEKTTVKENITHAQKLIISEQNDLNYHLQDYTQRDDTYQLALDKNSRYMPINFDSTGVGNIRLNLVAVFDSDVEPVVFEVFNQDGSLKQDLPFSAGEFKKQLPALFVFKDFSDSKSGIFSVNRRLMMIAARPILQSSRQGPASGTMIFGRFIEQNGLDYLSDLAQSQVHLYLLDDSSVVENASQVRDHLLNAPVQDVVVAPLEKNWVAGYSLIKDVNGQPEAILETIQQRFIFSQGEHFKNLFIAIIFALDGFIFVLIFTMVSTYLSRRKIHRDMLERYQVIVEQAGEAILLIDAQDGRILDANPASQRLLNINPSERIRAKIKDVFISGIDIEEITNRGGGVIENKCVLKDGVELEFEISSNPVKLNGRDILAILLRDISERKRVENALRSSEERYQLAVQGANDGLWDWNLVTDEIFYSSRWIKMLGFEGREISNSPDEWFDRVHPDDLWALRNAISYHLSQKTEYFHFEHRMRQKDGVYKWMLSRGAAYFKDGFARRIAGSQTDIDERKKIDEQLKFDALHDPLTRLPNRTLVLERIKQANRRSKRHGMFDFALLFLDLDRFKRINDTLGHAVGDQLLMEISHRIKACLRSMDTIARVSGDEFVILLEETHTSEEIIRVTERVLHSFDQPYYVAGREINLTTSIGVVIPDEEYEDVEEVIRDADIAMNASKELGRSRYTLFKREMQQNSVTRMDMERDLQIALESEQFIVQYQPIYSLENDELIGLEALVRWNHPTRGLLSPGEFISIAEETGLIIPMGFSVLRQACTQVKDWQRRIPQRTPITVSVNLSAKQFSQTHLFEEIHKILDECELDPQWLWLEVTESVLVQDINSATSTLQRLRQMGIHIEIDDFGTGYSSLAYLQTLPVDGIKIDRSFVNTIHINENDRKIVQTIIELCHSLGITEVAEGIETEAHKMHLKKLGCWYGQGYLYSRPQNPDKIELLLREKVEKLE
jgi:diguanylate cyclase (GGDEF)-like protein/PAS domain S-box-containing protein